MCNVVYSIISNEGGLFSDSSSVLSIPRFSSYRGRCEGQKDQLQLASQTHQIGDEDPRNLTESSKSVGKKFYDIQWFCFDLFWRCWIPSKFNDFLYVCTMTIYMYLFPFLKVSGGFLNLIVPMAAIGNGHHILCTRTALSELSASESMQLAGATECAFRWHQKVEIQTA